MDKQQKETIRVRMISCAFTVLALMVFKPFGLEAWQWQAYVHLLTIFVLGFGVCLLTDALLKYGFGMLSTTEQGVGYIIRRNLWFQIINTPLIALMICLYRHFVLSDRVKENSLSWGNYLETLIIIAFCSFAIGLYWRFKYRSRYLAAELEETRQLNEQLRSMQQQMVKPTNNRDVDTTTATEKNVETTEPASPVITLQGTTSDSVTLQVANLLYIEAVGNYAKVYHIVEEKVHTDMLRATLKQVEEDLGAYPTVVRCHRAFLVNLGQVEQIVARSGTMQLLIRQSHDFIPVSRSNMAQVKDTIKGIE